MSKKESYVLLSDGSTFDSLEGCQVIVVTVPENHDFTLDPSDIRELDNWEHKCYRVSVLLKTLEKHGLLKECEF
jgi:hypothetical protein